MAKDKPQVKRVSPYPIKAELIVQGKSFPASIVKLNTIGFFAEIDKVILRTYQSIECHFTLPVSQVSLHKKIRVMRTFDRSTPTGVQRMVECHFTDLGSEGREIISDFVTKIGQEKPG